MRNANEPTLSEFIRAAPKKCRRGKTYMYLTAEQYKWLCKRLRRKNIKTFDGYTVI